MFFAHQGFVVRYFLLDDGPNPPVHEYVERWPPAKRLAARFSDFVIGEATGG